MSWEEDTGRDGDGDKDEEEDKNMSTERDRRSAGNAGNDLEDTIVVPDGRWLA